MVQLKWRLVKKIVEEPDANLKKRKIGEPDTNPGGASKRHRQTHPR